METIKPKASKILLCILPAVCYVILSEIASEHPAHSFCLLDVLPLP